MLCKLAWGNVRRASRDYLVYLLTLTLAVTVFYAFNTISIQIDYASINEEGLSDLLGGIISGLTSFLAVVMGFLMVYANNFIMKRRKKEFGLYQVLGMSRGQVALVMALETIIVSAAALVLGIVLGVAVSQLMTFFTASLFRTQIADFHFFFSGYAFFLTLACLAGIFVVTLVFNLRVVARAKVIDLMSAGRKNEAVKTRSPWVSAAVFFAGAALIGISYFRLTRDGMPLDGGQEGMNAFAITTAMVAAGTVLLFFGLSGFLLKVLQTARGLYWRGLNMFTLRQLSAKVNTVSLSMAVIALILFLAITSVTTGMSLASVMVENVERNAPVDYSRTYFYYDERQAADSNAYAREYGYEAVYGVADAPVDVVAYFDTDERADGSDFDLDEVAGDYLQIDIYDAVPRGGTDLLISLEDLTAALGIELPQGVASSSGETSLQVMRESDFNRYLAFRGLEPVRLGEHGYTFTCDMGEVIRNVYNMALESGLELSFADEKLAPMQVAVDLDASAIANSTMGSNAGTIVVPDRLVEDTDLRLSQSVLLVNYAEGVTTEEGDAYLGEVREYGEPENAEGIVAGYWGMELTRTSAFESMNTMNGLISYLAIYIGFVLVIACAAILAVQQLSSVADTGKSCRILSELGTDRREIMGSMLVQQMVFFLFPLVVGVAHSLAALSVMVEMIEIFGGFAIANTVIFVTGIFLAAYGGYFVVTHLMSKGIVRDAIRVRYSG